MSMKVQLATKIDTEVKQSLDSYLNLSGITLSRFVENAIIDKLEELEDVQDYMTRRNDPLVSLSKVIKDLKSHGKI